MEVPQKKQTKVLLNLGKNIFSRELVWMANLSIENHHWHLHESEYHVFGARASEWVRKIKINFFYCLLNVQELEAMSKKLICYCKTVFWAKNSKKKQLTRPLPQVMEQHPSSPLMQSFMAVWVTVILQWVGSNCSWDPKLIFHNSDL